MDTATIERPTAVRGNVGRRGPSHEASFWIVAAAFVIATSFATTPTPLWGIYQQVDGFATFWLTIAFSSYVVGVIVSLVLFGHVSDWRGRKNLLLIAVALQLLSAGLLLTTTDLWMLIVARVVSGIGIGILTATATAFLAELNKRAGGSAARAVVVATAANMGGLGLGPIIGGLFAELSPEPLVAPWLMYVVALAAAVVLTVIPIETVTIDRERKYRPQRVAVEPEGRAVYFASAAGAFAFFAITGISGSLEPTFLGQLGVTSHLATGLASAAVFLAAAVSQVAVIRMPRGRQLTLGSILTGVGAAALAAGAAIPGATAVFIVGAVVGGAGGGILLKGALATAARLAPAGRTGEATAGIFVAAFLGMGVPVVVLGVLTAVGVDLAASMTGLGVVLVAIIAVAGSVLARSAREDA